MTLALDIQQMADILDRQHGWAINEIEPIANEGLRVHPDNWNNHNLILADVIASTVTSAGWIISSLPTLRSSVLIEPRVTQEITYQLNNTFLHVSPRNARNSIATRGLKIGTGGNTRVQRPYPPRLFLSTSIRGAFGFVNFQCRERLSTIENGRLILSTETNPHQFDIWIVSPPIGMKVHRDILFPDYGVWTPSAIPETHIKRMWYWRAPYAAWVCCRKLWKK